MADNRDTTNIKDSFEKGRPRKHWKIWSSKNRKPEKNLPKSKHHFSQEFIPRELPQGPILVNNFNLGTGKGKEICKADKGKLRISNNPRLRKIREKEERLLEIAKSINTTSENSKLITSIMGLTRSRITRFSAKVNEDGHVLIDEDMIENGMEGDDPRLGKSTFGQASYANKVTGQKDNPGEDLNAGRGTTESRKHVQTQRPNHQTEMRHRNVTIGGKPMDTLESSRINEHKKPTIASPGNQEEKGRQGPIKQSGTMGNVSATGMQRNGHPNVTVTETSNRFMLLDEDGNDLNRDMGTASTDSREDISLVESNSRWARKQERNLNISYNQSLNQDQRIEAKRYILQRQIPDPEVLDVWPKQQLNYFKQLCHLYEYGEGFRWASYVREEELESDDANEGTSQHCEEVDSESDATATFMKEDNLIPDRTPSEGMHLADGVDQVQMDMDNAHAGNFGLEN
ncbi:hypothetical protein L1987_58666 [Smallanthus sonchifolius]|uniref:Uncharacterized protein n=1 Tax=Smallanthus sonchifolius TaxID=185202 RepID=A0ACB9D345_9ASTR|nr:hypothetical protein L1987_58666 [Smallanthus sonchifolius]